MPPSRRVLVVFLCVYGRLEAACQRWGLQCWCSAQGHTIPYLALHALQVTGCRGLDHTVLWQAGLQPQAHQIPQQPLSGVHGAPGARSRNGEGCFQPGASWAVPRLCGPSSLAECFFHLCTPQGAGLAQEKVRCVLALGHEPWSQHFGAEFPPLMLTYCMT